MIVFEYLRKGFVVGAIYEKNGHVGVSCSQVGASVPHTVEVVISHRVELPPLCFFSRNY